MLMSKLCMIQVATSKIDSLKKADGKLYYL